MEIIERTQFQKPRRRIFLGNRGIHYFDPIVTHRIPGWNVLDLPEPVAQQPRESKALDIRQDPHHGITYWKFPLATSLDSSWLTRIFHGEGLPASPQARAPSKSLVSGCDQQ